MPQALFSGLVYDEQGQPAPVVFIGGEPHYVVEDQGMKFHIPSERVDRQILAYFRDLMAGHEDFISRETARWLGQDDPFTQAAIATQLKHMDQHFDEMLQMGLPEDVRMWLGLMGFRVTVDFRGQVLEVHLPGGDEPPDFGPPEL